MSPGLFPACVCLGEGAPCAIPGSLNPHSGISGSCKKSLLWGNLVGQCHVDTEEEEDLELEEVSGDSGPSLSQSS